MGLSATYALKMAADSAFSRGDVAEGNRLMKQYKDALARAEKEKIEREIKLAEAKKKKIEEERKKAEQAEKKKKVK